MFKLDHIYQLNIVSTGYTYIGLCDEAPKYSKNTDIIAFIRPAHFKLLYTTDPYWEYNDFTQRNYDSKQITCLGHKNDNIELLI